MGLEDQVHYTAFIAYAGADSQKAQELGDALHRIGLAHFLAARDLRGGMNWPTVISEAQQNSRMTVVLVSRHTTEAFYENEEIANAIALSRSGSHLVVPVYLSEMPSVVPYGLRIKQAIFWTPEKTADSMAKELIEACLADTPQPIPGIAPRGAVFGSARLDGQVFAAELLTQPLLLQRQDVRE